MRHLRHRHGSDHNHSPDTSAAKREREAALKRRRQKYQRTLSEQTQAIHQAQRDQRLLRGKQERYKVVGNKEARLQEQLRRSQKLKLGKRSYEKTKTKRHEVVRKRRRQMARKRKPQQPRPEDMEVQLPLQEQEGRHGTSSEATMAHQRRMPGFSNTRSPETSEAEYKWQENLERKRRKRLKELDIRAQVRRPEQQPDQRDQQLRSRKLDNPEEASDKEARLQEQLRRSQKLKLGKRSYEKTKMKRHEVVRKRRRQMARKRKGQQPRPEDMEVQPPLQEQEVWHGTSSEATMAHQRHTPGLHHTRGPETSEAKYKWQENLKRKRRKRRKELDIRAQVRRPEQQQDQRDQQLRSRKLDHPEEASDKVQPPLQEQEGQHGTSSEATMAHQRHMPSLYHTRSPETSEAEYKWQENLERKRRQRRKELDIQAQVRRPEQQQDQRDQQLRRRKLDNPDEASDKEPLLPEDPKRPRQLEDRKKTHKKSSKMPCKMAREKPRQMAQKRKHPQYHPEEGEEPQLPEGPKRPRHLEDRKKTQKKSSKMLSKVALETPRQMTRKRKHQQQCPEECKLPGTSFGVPPTKHSPPTSVPRDLAEPQAPKLHHGTQTLEEAAKAPSRRDTSQQTNYRVAVLDQEIVQVSKDSKPALSTAKQLHVAGRSPKDQKCGRHRGAPEEPQAKGHVVEPRPGGDSRPAEGQRQAQPGHHTTSSPATAAREHPPAAE